MRSDYVVVTELPSGEAVEVYSSRSRPLAQAAATGIRALGQRAHWCRRDRLARIVREVNPGQRETKG